MPITPLHLAVGFPAKHLAKGKFSMKAFILVNIAIDIQPGLVMYFLDKDGRFGLEMHGISHTIIGATLIAALIGLVLTGVLWKERESLGRCWAGLVFGAWSHILLDALVHDDMYPFVPLIDGNPFYMGWIEPISLICLLVTLWYGVPWVLFGVRKVSGRLFGDHRRRLFADKKNLPLSKTNFTYFSHTKK